MMFYILQQQTKKKVQAEAQARVQEQKMKIHQIKNILGEPSDSDSQNMPPPPTAPRTRSRTATGKTFVAPASSEPDLSKQEGQYSLRGSHKRAMTAYTNSVRQAAAVPKPRTRSPPPTKPVRFQPIVNNLCILCTHRYVTPFLYKKKNSYKVRIKTYILNMVEMSQAKYNKIYLLNVTE